MALHVKDIQTSTQFYRDVVGLKQLSVPDNLKAIRSWFDLNDGQQIHLMANRASLLRIIHYIVGRPSTNWLVNSLLTSNC
ncbi:MAG: VOC family protein [Rudanella sp.]|nr:VOC family protein [Rudanella sp.]